MTGAIARCETRAGYRWFFEISTRWMDMDVYGQANNVLYYSYFDTAVAAQLIEHAGLKPLASPVISVLWSRPNAPLKLSLVYPEVIDAGTLGPSHRNGWSRYGCFLWT